MYVKGKIVLEDKELLLQYPKKLFPLIRNIIISLSRKILMKRKYISKKY